jgi:hypothetical protein
LFSLHGKIGLKIIAFIKSKTLREMKRALLGRTPSFEEDGALMGGSSNYRILSVYNFFDILINHAYNISGHSWREVDEVEIASFKPMTCENYKNSKRPSLLLLNL